nr:hypothetical protein GCM10010200_104730 [Actinomadura rugatobispora]
MPAGEAIATVRTIRVKGDFLDRGFIVLLVLRVSAAMGHAAVERERLEFIGRYGVPRNGAAHVPLRSGSPLAAGAHVLDKGKFGGRATMRRGRYGAVR